MSQRQLSFAKLTRFFLGGAALLCAACAAGEPDASKPGLGAFSTGHYRNLFAEAGHPPAEVRKKIDSAFEQLFHGDAATQTVYYATGSNSNGPLAYVTDIRNHDVRTEGLSYGMMIAVQLNRRAEFDALWNWSNTYLFNTASNHPSYGFFSWHADTNGVPIDEFVAPDGEEYYVTALYFAAGRWPGGKGLYDYRARADQLLSRMRHRAVISGPLRRRGGQATVTAGPLFDAEHKMVLFSPSSERNRFTDPSYHLPAFYELWSRWGAAEDRAFWADAAAASRDFFPRVTHPVTALNPNYANFDGTVLTNFGRSANFSFDACRTAMNWSVDWAWWGKDAREQQLSDRLQAFFESKGMTNYGCQFTLDGRQLDDRHAQGLVAMNAVASLASTDPHAKEFVEALWNTPVPDGIQRYYEGLLYMMALLHCSGEFRIWSP
jgi:oligosaccharide reducing-end xylanase